jgi:predicted nucleotidyltransferase
MKFETKYSELLEKLIMQRLNPAIWNDGKIDERARKAIMQVAQDFLDSLKVKLEPVDIVLTGSSANYNWTSESDIDVHIIVDFKKVKTVDPEVLDDYVYDASSLWGDYHKIKIKNFPVEIFVQNVSEKLPYSSGVYSLKSKKWIQQPILIKDPSDDYIKMKAKPWRTKIEKVLKKATDTKNPKPLVVELDNLRLGLRALRSKALVQGGEHAVENLIFKHLRKEGLIDKLKETSRKIYDQSVSIMEAKLALAEISSWE